MTLLTVVCAGDTETFAACSREHGGGTYTLTAGSLNPILKIRGNLVIVRGQPWQAHCPASAGTASPHHQILKVRGIPVCLAGDKSTSACHASEGIMTRQNMCMCRP